MMWQSSISPTSVSRDIDPLSLRGIESQRRRLEAKRIRKRTPKTCRWPRRKAISARLRTLIQSHKPENPRLPPPVSIYAGRFEAALIWREDVETFGAYLTDTNPASELEARWFGQTPGQYPTVESLAEALAAFDVGMDDASAALAKSYQNRVWEAVGPCHLAGIRQEDGAHEMAIVTPQGRVQPLIAEAERSERSERFGPVSDFGWGEDDPRGALETARAVLDYVDSTGRTSNELFDAAREFSQTSVRNWPAEFAVSVSEVHGWSWSRSLVVHRNHGPAVEALRSLAQRPPTRMRDPVERKIARQPPAHSWPQLADIGPTTERCSSTQSTGPTTRLPKRTRPVERNRTR